MSPFLFEVQQESHQALNNLEMRWGPFLIYGYSEEVLETEQNPLQLFTKLSDYVVFPLHTCFKRIKAKVLVLSTVKCHIN